jgi:hypothetical protein
VSGLRRNARGDDGTLGEERGKRRLEIEASIDRQHRAGRGGQRRTARDGVAEHEARGVEVAKDHRAVVAADLEADTALAEIDRLLLPGLRPVRAPDAIDGPGRLEKTDGGGKAEDEPRRLIAGDAGQRRATSGR